MESNQPQGGQGNKPEIAITDLNIVLDASSFDPAHINPDFLRHNGIVNSDWQVEYPVIIESGFSLVKYTNGLSLTADRDSLAVSQTGSSLVPEEIVVPEIVNRYLTVAPWQIDCTVISTNLRGSISIADSSVGQQISPLHRLAQEVPFGGVIPNLQVRVFYGFSDKSITMYVVENTDENIITGINFRAHIHRDMDKDEPLDERREFIPSVVEKSKEDLNDFVELARQFYFNYLQEEN